MLCVSHTRAEHCSTAQRDVARRSLLSRIFNAIIVEVSGSQRQAEESADRMAAHKAKDIGYECGRIIPAKLEL